MTVIPIYLFLVAILIRPQDWVAGMEGLPILNIIMTFGLALGLANAIKEHKKYLVIQNWMMLAYLLVILISTLISAGSNEAIEQTILYLKRVAVYFMMISLLSSQKDLLWVSGLFKIIVLFLSYQAILQALTGECWGGLTPYPGYTEIRVRWYGDWDGPNVLGLLFVIAISLSLEYIFGNHGLAVRLFHILSSASYLVAIYFTNSRGAILAVICAISYYFCIRRNLLTIILGILVVAVILVLGPSRMKETHSRESSAHERTWLWEQGLTFLIQNPLIGIGRGQFAKRSDLKLIAHNNFVQNFSELGIVGFSLFSSILWFSYKGLQFICYFSKNANSVLSAHSRSVSCALVGFIACTFFVVMECEIYYWLLGIAASTYLIGKRTLKLPNLNFDRNDLITVGCLMAGVIGIVWLIGVKEII